LEQELNLMFSVAHLNKLRLHETERIVGFLTPGARILEIGAGTGQQAAELSARGFQIAAIEIQASNYAEERLFDIVDYDGRTLPFPDHSFDIIFSSNVLEHVPDLRSLHAEIRRVLVPNGYCVHVLPTHSWRFWTTLSSFPDAFLYAGTTARSLIPNPRLNRNEIRRLRSSWLAVAKRCASAFFQRRHGERGNLISETWLFHPSWWRRNFIENGFEIIRDEPMGLFYTGNMLLGARWSFASRHRVSAFLGSACHVFKISRRNNAL
jgi:SAM-dependent methyltransferase